MSAIEALQLDAAYVAVAKSLGLPTQSYMALSDGPILDAQAGAETFGSALIAALAGVNSVSGPGMLDFLLVFSLPKLVFDDEMCGQALRFVRDVAVQEDLPTTDLIATLMADQHLIMADHTTRHWPTELYLPSAVIDRDNRENWTRQGGKDTYERATAEVERRLAAYQPLVTDPAIDLELQRIIRSGLVDQTVLPAVPPALEPVAVSDAGRRRHNRRREMAQRPPRGTRGAAVGERLNDGERAQDRRAADRGRRYHLSEPFLSFAHQREHSAGALRQMFSS